MCYCTNSISRLSRPVTTQPRRTYDSLVTECGKCKGTGFISAFQHYAAGICFACEGSGKVTSKIAHAHNFDADSIREILWHPSSRTIAIDQWNEPDSPLGYGSMWQPAVAIDHLSEEAKAEYRLLWQEMKKAGRTRIGK